MAAKKDIYYNGRIYTGITDSNMLLINILKITGYLIIGSHSFKDGQDVTGLYDLKYRDEWEDRTKDEMKGFGWFKRVIAIPTPPDGLDRESKSNGMDELKIYRFQALHIEDTFRIVANILKSRSKETCIDRQICKSIEMINEILKQRIESL